VLVVCLYLFTLLFNVSSGLSDPAINADFSAAYNVTNFRLEDFTYSRDYAKRLLFQHLEQTNFIGITVSRAEN